MPSVARWEIPAMEVFKCFVRWAGWWLTYPSEKYESQMGLLFPIYGKMFQTTNQWENNRSKWRISQATFDKTRGYHVFWTTVATFDQRKIGFTDDEHRDHLGTIHDVNAP